MKKKADTRRNAVLFFDLVKRIKIHFLNESIEQRDRVTTYLCIKKRTAFYHSFYDIESITLLCIKK